jgi:hypothetical protein
MARPSSDEHAAYYSKYIGLVPEDDIVLSLESEVTKTLELLHSISDHDGSLIHPPYTWTIKQVVGHLSDSERVFGYRALRIGRGDETPLSGFDENRYALAAASNDQTLEELTDEFGAVRRASISLFRSLPAIAWERRGVANGASVSVRALAYILVGHERHHMAVIRRRLGR